MTTRVLHGGSNLQDSYGCRAEKKQITIVDREGLLGVALESGSVGRQGSYS